MGVRLTDRVVRELPFPERGSKVTFDIELKGFGVRCTAGSRAFVLAYRTAEGKQRQLTIGSFPEWTTILAREEAARSKREVDLGNDPMQQRDEARLAPTMKDLARLYLSEYALPYKAPKSVYDDRLMIRRFIDPTITLHGAVADAPEPYRVDNPLDREIARTFGSAKVRGVDFAQIDRLHQQVTSSGRRITANRLSALLSKMFSFGERRGLRDRGSNPCKGAPRNTETKREAVFSDEQVAKLILGIGVYPHRTAADAIMLALLTGARTAEVLQARWSEIDFGRGVWVKPARHTKQRQDHRLPLGVPALRLLEDRRNEVACEWVFPGRKGGHRLTSVRKAWTTICAAAGIPHGREAGFVVHDLRHQFASIAISSGASLAMVGGLLGHTQAQTTMRYAHLFERPLRAVSDAVGRQLIPVPSQTPNSNNRPA
jgi:integrase